MISEMLAFSVKRDDSDVIPGAALQGNSMPKPIVQQQILRMRYMPNYTFWSRGVRFRRSQT